MISGDVGVLFTEEQIRLRVMELAAEIGRHLPPGEIDVIGVLTGAFVFTADLVRELERPCRTDFVKVSSYGTGRESSGKIELLLDTSLGLRGRNVLLVEDIIDSGFTIDFLHGHLRSKQPAGLWTAALLFKRGTGVDHLRSRLDFVGFEIDGDPYVVGYGMDDAQRWRNLPFIGIAGK